MTVCAERLKSFSNSALYKSLRALEGVMDKLLLPLIHYWYTLCRHSRKKSYLQVFRGCASVYFLDYRKYAAYKLGYIRVGFGNKRQIVFCLYQNSFQKASRDTISCTLDINAGACEEANVSSDSLTTDRPRCTTPLLFLTAGQDPAHPEALFLVPVWNQLELKLPLPAYFCLCECKKNPPISVAFHHGVFQN